MTTRTTSTLLYDATASAAKTHLADRRGNPLCGDRLVETVSFETDLRSMDAVDCASCHRAATDPGV